MQYKWLNRQNNKNLIVFFNGWGMDERIVSSLNSVNFDVIVFYDYRNMHFESCDFSKYDKKYLIAWSMGVYVCNYFYEYFKNFDKLVAINGTQSPIDDNYGIPSKIYDITVNNFNEMSCSKFMKKISATVDLKGYSSRSVQNLKDELVAIKNLKIDKFLNFNKVILSTKDRIFPFENMMNFWSKQQVDIIKTEKAHYLFDSYKNWSDFI